jgi:hypothetical protein
VDNDRRSPEAPCPPVASQAREGFGDAGAFLRQLIPFPSSAAVGPLALLPLGVAPAAVPAGATGAAAPAADEAAAIVSQAAAILDAEMARGVLAAHGGARAPAPGLAEPGHPVLRQMHEFVEQLAAVLPGLQGAAATGAAAPRPPAADDAPLVRLAPEAAARPGERVRISMTLRNGEGRPVEVRPVATDLVGGHGGRIAGALVEFAPSTLALQPQERKELVISLAVPADALPGRHSGLIVMQGLDYLRAIVTLEVAGAPATSVGASPPPPRAVETAAPAGSLAPPAAGRLPARPGAVMQEAVRLARDGELGNSDAIALLQMPHHPQEIQDVLARFEKVLTREARSKLTLAARVPLPAGVDNQRYEPIFDRYPISGATYVTGRGEVVLDEVQYYNGEMVQLHGGCTNLAAVRDALAGSGYQPMILRRADGSERAVVQFWAHQLSDTSLRPYNAMFLIVAALRADVPAAQACLRADGDGAASVLPMLDGRFDPLRRAYDNKATLYFVRLLDSTAVAIDVGRERMGTDKRPGTIELKRDGPRREFAIRDGAQRAVARIRFTPTDDPSAWRPALARAAALAGIAVGELPAGIEYVYPGAARIGEGPVVTWDWRTDVIPRFQPARADTLALDAGSELGATLIRWGFEPHVLGWIPNVRGVITGIPA